MQIKMWNPQVMDYQFPCSFFFSTFQYAKCWLINEALVMMYSALRKLLVTANKPFTTHVLGETLFLLSGCVTWIWFDTAAIPAHATTADNSKTSNVVDQQYAKKS